MLLTSSSLFFLRKETHVEREPTRQVVQTSACRPPRIYVHICTFVLCSHVRHICMLHVLLQYFWIVPSRPDTRAHIRVPHVQCVCACVHTQTKHTYQPLDKNGFKLLLYLFPFIFASLAIISLEYLPCIGCARQAFEHCSILKIVYPKGFLLSCHEISNLCKLVHSARLSFCSTVRSPALAASTPSTLAD